MITRPRQYLALLACALLLSCSDPDEGNGLQKEIGQLEQEFELKYHQDLIDLQARPGSTLAGFITDGCSGGLSVGWEYLAGRIDGLREQHGALPPWEDCCVTHDRPYHIGAVPGATALDSYQARQQADLALQACVIETGNERAVELSAEYGVPVETVYSLYETIAGLMYRAVRLGGMPCSGLPWRWGYGWPECS